MCEFICICFVYFTPQLQPRWLQDVRHNFEVLPSCYFLWFIQYFLQTNMNIHSLHSIWIPATVSFPLLARPWMHACLGRLHLPSTYSTSQKYTWVYSKYFQFGRTFFYLLLVKSHHPNVSTYFSIKVRSTDLFSIELMLKICLKTNWSHLLRTSNAVHQSLISYLQLPECQPLFSWFSFKTGRRKKPVNKSSTVKFRMHKLVEINKNANPITS